MEPKRIALFPLNAVLFPGMPLPLHVFEPRYQELVRACLEGDRTFGVTLIRSGEEVGGPADPHAVGTTCEILSVTPLGEGRLSLTTVGRQRFRVLRLHHELPYLEAEVELLPDPSEDAPAAVADEVRASLAEYIRAMLALSGDAEQEFELPENPTHLSWVAGAVLQVPLPVRQDLLEISDTTARLEAQQTLLRAELERLNAGGSGPIVARPLKADPSQVSLN